jgi:hypothetical protein
MAIIVAKLMLIKCEQDHTKHEVEKFSYVKRDPLRSCAFCVDKVEGFADWEIELLKDTNFTVSDRHLMAANLRNMAYASVK